MLTQSFVYKNKDGKYFVGSLYGIKTVVTDDINKAQWFSSFAELQSTIHHESQEVQNSFMEPWEEITFVSGY